MRSSQESRCGGDAEWVGALDWSSNCCHNLRDRRHPLQWSSWEDLALEYLNRGRRRRPDLVLGGSEGVFLGFVELRRFHSPVVLIHRRRTVALDHVQQYLDELDALHFLDLWNPTSSERRSRPPAQLSPCPPACPPCPRAAPWSGRRSRARDAAAEEGEVAALLLRLVVLCQGVNTSRQVCKISDLIQAIVTHLPGMGSPNGSVTILAKLERSTSPPSFSVSLSTSCK